MSPTDDLIIRYNYDEFTQDKFVPWMTFDSSPPLGQAAPDFPLWPLEEESKQGKSSLSAIWSSHLYTIVEFGSFT